MRPSPTATSAVGVAAWPAAPAPSGYGSRPVRRPTEIESKGGYLGLLTGKTDVDYGSGFFAGGDVAKHAVQRGRAAAPLIDNHAVTWVVTPRSRSSSRAAKPYGVVSGLVDLTSALALGSVQLARRRRHGALQSQAGRKFARSDRQRGARGGSVQRTS